MYLILTNPPFGGEEEKVVLNNFPTDNQTLETALLFLQLIMRKLRRPSFGKAGGRCAMVVPNGTLFGDGVAFRIRMELLKEFNLHTIVRLPKGVFEPYADIPTNILFFERNGSTKQVWFYELPLLKGKKQYSKTQPLNYEDFNPIISWWNDRVENDYAWVVSIEDILHNNANLDIKNPKRKENEYTLPHLIIDQIVAEVIRQLCLPMLLKPYMIKKTRC